MKKDFKDKIKNWIENVSVIRQEESAIIKLLGTLSLTPENRILEVGCGFGKKMCLLRAYGLNVTGVDINTEIVKKNIDDGLDCMTVEEFNSTDEIFDVILMSHVIEHLMPKDLVFFMDNYLDRLKEGGHLIIATPLQTPHFYEDFDHVKPYYPMSIQMVFGIDTGQIQYTSRNKIALLRIWLRRSPFKLTFLPYRKPNYYIPDIINLLLIILFRLTFGLIGIKTGWVGLYRKLYNQYENI